MKAVAFPADDRAANLDVSSIPMGAAGPCGHNLATKMWPAGQHRLVGDDVRLQAEAALAQRATRVRGANSAVPRGDGPYWGNSTAVAW